MELFCCLSVVQKENVTTIDSVGFVSITKIRRLREREPRCWLQQSATDLSRRCSNQSTKQHYWWHIILSQFGLLVNNRDFTTADCHLNEKSRISWSLVCFDGYRKLAFSPEHIKIHAQIHTFGGRECIRSDWLTEHIWRCLSVFCFTVSYESVRFVLLCKLRGRSLEQTLWIKFIRQVQTEDVCARSGSRAVPLFLFVHLRGDIQPSVHAMSTSSARTREAHKSFFSKSKSSLWARLQVNSQVFAGQVKVKSQVFERKVQVKSQDFEGWVQVKSQVDLSACAT